MNCKKCGEEVLPQDAFCPACGAPLKKKRRNSPLATAAALAAVAAVIAGGLYLQETAPETPAALPQLPTRPAEQATTQPSTEPKLQGWMEVNGETCYYRDGTALTGWQELEGVGCYFDENGYLQYTRQSWLDSDWTDQSATFGTEDGGRASVGYHALTEPVEDCVAFTHNLDITEIEFGDVEGEWIICIRVDGSWKKVHTFTLTGTKAETRVEFAEPVSFDAFTVYRYTSGSNSYYYNQFLTEAVTEY